MFCVQIVCFRSQSLCSSCKNNSNVELITFYKIFLKCITKKCLFLFSRQMPVLPDPTTPQAGPVYTPEYFKGNAFEKPFVTDFDTDSPDSGHKEMSTESLAVQYQNSNTSYWQNVLNGELISLSSPSSFVPGTICHVVEDIAAVTGNPFASGFTETFEDQEFLKANEHIITPCPPQDACGNRLELKLAFIIKTKRISNFKSTRANQCNVWSSIQNHLLPTSLQRFLRVAN